jgi:hypothetical protein
MEIYVLISILFGLLIAGISAFVILPFAGLNMYQVMFILMNYTTITLYTLYTYYWAEVFIQTSILAHDPGYKDPNVITGAYSEKTSGPPVTQLTYVIPRVNGIPLKSPLKHVFGTPVEYPLPIVNGTIEKSDISATKNPLLNGTEVTVDKQIFRGIRVPTGVPVHTGTPLIPIRPLPNNQTIMRPSETTFNPLQNATNQRPPVVVVPVHRPPINTQPAQPNNNPSPP